MTVGTITTMQKIKFFCLSTIAVAFAFFAVALVHSADQSIVSIHQLIYAEHQELSVGDVIGAQSQFKDLHQPGSNSNVISSVNDQTLWLKIVFKHSAELPESMIASFNDRAVGVESCYRVNESETTPLRSIVTSRYAVSIDLRKQNELTWLCRIRSKNMVSTKMTVYGQNQFWEIENKLKRNAATIFGFNFSLAIVCLFLYLQTRSSLNILVGSTIIFYLSWMTLGHGFTNSLLSENRIIQSTLFGVFTVIIPAMHIYTVKTYYQLSDCYPKINRFYIWATLYVTIIVLGGYFYGGAFAALYLYAPVGVFFALGSLAIGVKLIRAGRKDIVVFLTPMTVILINSSYIFLILMGVIDFSDTYYSIECWISIAYCFGMSLVIAYRTLLIKREDEIEMRKAIDRATQFNKRSEYLAKMAHEIRAPMNGVLGISALLKALSENRRFISLVCFLESAALRMLCTINNILDVSKLDANKMLLENKASDLKDLAENVIADSANKVLFKYIEFSLQVDDVIRYVKTDTVRIKQILSNLVDNATHNCKTGTIVVAIRAGAGGGVLIAVKDARGVDRPEYVIEMFNEKDSSGYTLKHTPAESDMRIILVKQIVQLMGGKHGCLYLHIDGSTFWCELPLRIASDEEIEVLKAEKRNRDAVIRPLKILLVDDNTINLMIISQRLKKMGHQVSNGENGARAVELVSKEEFDIVLMDCEMPVMDGYEATREIRSMKAGTKKKLPIYALSANTPDEIMAKCVGCGMEGALKKPIDEQELCAILRTL